MVDAELSTQSEERNELHPRSAAAVVLALISSAIFVFFRAPGIVLTPISFFDEGLQLASGTFAENGLIAFRDYYVPYGPANAYLLAVIRSVGFDSLEASRALFVLLNAAIAGLGTYLVLRRTGIFAAAVFTALIVAFPPASSYSGVVLLTIASFLTAIGWRMSSRVRPLVEAPSRSNEARLLVAGALLALTVWFRWEFGLVLLVWLVLVVRTPGRTTMSRIKLTLVPLSLAVAPYVAIIAFGGGKHLFEAIEYAVSGYPRYRSLPFPLGAPWEFVTSTWSSRVLNYEQMVFTISFFAIALFLLLVMAGPFADRSERWQWARVFERDDTHMIVVVGATAGFLMFNLRTRPDVAHASQLMVLGWLVALWSRPRYRQMGVTVGVVVMTLLLVVIQPLQTTRLASAISQFQTSTSENVQRMRYVIPGAEVDDLREISKAWNRYLLANPRASKVVFVANRSNSLTHTNAPIVYWLLEARPAYWLTTFDPGFADQEDQQLRMIDALCESGAALVLREPVLGPEHPPDRRFSETLDNFITANYELVFRTELYDLLQPSEAMCELTQTL